MLAFLALFLAFFQGSTAIGMLVEWFLEELEDERILNEIIEEVKGSGT